MCNFLPLLGMFWGSFCYCIVSIFVKVLNLIYLLAYTIKYKIRINFFNNYNECIFIR